MLRLYCREQHSGKELCQECSELLAYAHKRLGLCKFAEQKPTCGQCPVHCYEPDMRSRITAVMKYAGPRMLLHHPVEALNHLLDGFRT